MEVNSSLLVASANTQPDIDTYKIGSDGAITLATQFDYSKQTGYKAGECGGVSDLYFDRSGQSVYATVNNYQCADNNAIASFAVDPSAASLNYLGIENIGYDSSPQIAFLGNNAFAYSALNDTCMYGGIDSFARGSNGLLTSFATNATPQQGPPAPPGAASAGVKLASYAAGLTATDNANHIAMEEDPCFQQNGTVATQVQLAVWTADATGAVTTTDTSATMPGNKITTPMDMKISPDGTLLAVGGIGGLQIFHFNGANSITADTDVLTTDPHPAVAWDNQNHLYAITLAGASPGINPGKLYVFTVLRYAQGSTAPQQAPGSPYTLAMSVGSCRSVKINYLTASADRPNQDGPPSDSVHLLVLPLTPSLPCTLFSCPSFSTARLIPKNSKPNSPSASSASIFRNRPSSPPSSSATIPPPPPTSK